LFLANGYVHFYCVVGSSSLEHTRVSSITSNSWDFWLFLENAVC